MANNLTAHDLERVPAYIEVKQIARIIRADDTPGEFLHAFKVIRITNASDTFKNFPDYIDARKKIIDCFLQSEAFNLDGFKVPL